ncbi:MAG: beta-xylosidase [Clostridiales bacterium]|jgi:xylan 1,4-beta-xylosidase|nr:beta-xylosidase [Clostridiales bacterium]
MTKFDFSVNTNRFHNDRYWTFCVGSCHAALALRADYQAQLKKTREELGFERVRFHGLFNDDMKVITRLSDYIPLMPGAKKVKTQSFYHIALVFDFLLSIGMRPFVELGFMPTALASGKRTAFYYKGNITRPKNMGDWEQFVKDFLTFCFERYGREEVRKWYFEVWNEPNLPFFFKGSQRDYFRFYAATARAVKSADEGLRVGGPATSENAWLSETRSFCEKNNVPLDFLSTHHYPGDDVGLPMFTLRNMLRMGLTALRNPGDSVDRVIRKMLNRPELLPLVKRDSMRKQLEAARVKAGPLPLLYTEWSDNPVCTAPSHDTAGAAAFIVKHAMDGQGLIDGCSFWTFSDIYEELTFFARPFSGTFGLQTVHGIPKPAYHAFALLGRLGDERFALPVTHEPIEMAAFKKGGTLQFLLYRQNYCEGTAAEEEVELRVDMPLKNAVCRRIDRNNGNPLAYWRAMGAPETLLPGQADEIAAASALREMPLRVERGDGASVLRIGLADNDVVLAEAEIDENVA